LFIYQFSLRILTWLEEHQIWSAPRASFFTSLTIQEVVAILPKSLWQDKKKTGFPAQKKVVCCFFATYAI